MVSVAISATVCGVPIAATVTVPTLCVTSIVNALLLAVSPVVAVAVSANGPYVPTDPQAGVHTIWPVSGSNVAPARQRPGRHRPGQRPHRAATPSPTA